MPRGRKSSIVDGSDQESVVSSIAPTATLVVKRKKNFVQDLIKRKCLENSMKSDEIENYECGDLVFAKVPRFDPWPARIEDVVQLLDDASNTDYIYSVMFFGTHEIWHNIPAKNVWMYNGETLKKFGKPKKLKIKFMEALSECEQSCTVLPTDPINQPSVPGPSSGLARTKNSSQPYNPPVDDSSREETYDASALNVTAKSPAAKRARYEDEGISNLEDSAISIPAGNEMLNPEVDAILNPQDDQLLNRGLNEPVSDVPVGFPFDVSAKDSVSDESVESVSDASVDSANVTPDENVGPETSNDYLSANDSPPPINHQPINGADPVDDPVFCKQLVHIQALIHYEIILKMNFSQLFDDYDYEKCLTCLEELIDDDAFNRESILCAPTLIMAINRIASECNDELVEQKAKDVISLVVLLFDDIEPLDLNLDTFLEMFKQKSNDYLLANPRLNCYCRS